MATKKKDEAQSLDLDDLFGPQVAPEPTLRVVPVSDDLPISDEQRGAMAARDRFAREIGARSEEIDVVYDDIGLRLMEGGVLVDIDVHRWSGKVQLQPKELGLDKGPSSRVIRLGEKLLMPPFILRRANSIVAQLRQNLERHSHRTAWGRWVTALAYQEWRKEHNRLVSELEEIATALADNIELIKSSSDGMWGELRRLYAEEARRAWCRSNRYAASESNLDLCPAWFVDEYVDRILAYIPTAAEIRKSFYVEAKISFIPLPSMLAEDQARSARVWERKREEQDFERRQREAREAMEADIRAQYESEKRTMIDDFLAGLAGQIYSRLYDVSSWAVNTMARNQGRLMEPTIRQINGLIEWARMMDVNNDAQVQKAISDLAGLVGQSGEARSAEDVQAKLKDIGTVARSVLLDLRLEPELADAKLSTGQRDALLGIGQRLSRAEVAQARERLGTAEVPELPIVRARRGGQEVKAFQEI